MYGQATNPYVIQTNFVASGGAGQKAPGGLENEAENLHRTCEELEKAFAAINERLQAVLLPANPSVGGGGANGLVGCGSPLREKFASAAERLSRLVAHMHELRGRIDL